MSTLSAKEKKNNVKNKRVQRSKSIENLEMKEPFGCYCIFQTFIFYKIDSLFSLQTKKDKNILIIIK